MRRKTPIALFAYNRPQHLELALGSLARCDRLDECDLHIFSDGPKSPKQATAVEASRRIGRDWANRLGAEVVERSENCGLSRSVVAGVTELSESYGRVIVLEDDLIVTPDFLKYMIQSLDRYRDEPQVLQISGYMFPVQYSPCSDVFFLPLTTTWGWATWDRAWRIFDWEATGSREKLADPQVRWRFNLDDSYPYTTMLKDRLKGRNDSWGILWWWAVFSVGGLVLHPKQSLVWVGGWDRSGTHCDSMPDFIQPSPEAFKRPRLPQPVAFPEKIIADEKAFERIKLLLRAQGRSQKKSLRNRLQHRANLYLRKLVP